MFLTATSLLSAILGFLAVAKAIPTPNIASTSEVAVVADVEKRSMSCDKLASGLNQADCTYISSLGFAGQGTNAKSGSNGKIWLGSDGASVFTFTNEASEAVILVVWYDAPGTYTASFPGSATPMVTYSLPSKGSSVQVSAASGVSGAWAALYGHKTKLTQYGQIDNTWGEFTTGAGATVDVSREVNMAGNSMSIKGSNGCVSDMNTCVFVCASGNTCGDSGTYKLLDCAAGSQAGAASGTSGGNPSGGCQGWKNVTVSLGN